MVGRRSPSTYFTVCQALADMLATSNYFPYPATFIELPQRLVPIPFPNLPKHCESSIGFQIRVPCYVVSTATATRSSRSGKNDQQRARLKMQLSPSRPLDPNQSAMLGILCYDSSYASYKPLEEWEKRSITSEVKNATERKVSLKRSKRER